MNIQNICAVFGTVMLTVTAGRTQQPLRLSLAECRERALAHSEALLQADNRLEQARLDRQLAATAALPNIAGSITGAYVLPDMDMMGMELRMRGTYMAGLSLTQPIYAGGKISAARRMARIGEEVAGEQQRMTRMDVLVEADNAYWTLVAVNGKVRMLESYAAQMDTLYSQVSGAVEAGMTLENDRLRVAAKRSEIRYQLDKARNGADLCRMSLCRIIGVGSEVRPVPTDTLFHLSAPGQLNATLETRPELRLLEQQVALGEQKIRDVRSAMLPTAGLSLGYTYYGNIKLQSMVDAGNGVFVPYSQEFRDGLGLAVVAVKVPVFHWGEGRKQVRKARYELQNAQLDLQKNTRLMSLEVEQAIRNVEDGYRLIQTAELGLRQAEENLRVMDNRHAAQMAPLTDLLDAQAQWQQAASNLIEAQTQYRIYKTAYWRSIGQLE
ncbi:MAG TPA: TolC family protein [Candidatus Rikenella faecigallinarum]|uniref:TolC family protein n=1 Tax=Candidatus Rikenella faecigallinarum TaxID=2838745 RepID=A0A9D1QDG0_9BACT|nr:TolC family protein [Candidatus Rikenella faecigallinarum]